MGELVRRVREFNEERGWDKMHEPSRLLAALVSEMGELADQYKWGSHRVGSADRGKAIGDELADIIIYAACIALAEGIDLDDAVARKLKRNAIKYPVSGESSE